MSEVPVASATEEAFQSAEEEESDFHSPTSQTDCGSNTEVNQTTETANNSEYGLHAPLGSCEKSETGEQVTLVSPNDAPAQADQLGNSNVLCGDELQPGSSTADPEAALEAAETCKVKGNDLFKDEKHVEAIEMYEQALSLAPSDAPQKAIYEANKAACLLALSDYRGCIECCSIALKINPEYIKALRRKMTAHKELDELDSALEDAKKIVQLDPSDIKTKQNIEQWTPIVAEKQEKMKEEVLGKLKDLGNTVLGNFGLSLDNFKMDKDPNSGGYSIRFEQ